MVSGLCTTRLADKRRRSAEARFHRDKLEGGEAGEGRSKGKETKMSVEIAKPQAVHSGENIEVAYQLDWSLTIFWREPLWTDDWFEPL